MTPSEEVNKIEISNREYNGIYNRMISDLIDVLKQALDTPRYVINIYHMASISDSARNDSVNAMVQLYQRMLAARPVPRQMLQYYGNQRR